MNFIERMNFDFIDFIPFSERPFKSKFIPAKVWKNLDRYKTDLSKLKGYFKQYRTRVSLEAYEEVINIGGSYDSQEERITLHLYSNNFLNYDFNNSESMNWEDFKFSLIQTFMHELIHYMQFSNRQEYYGKVYRYERNYCNDQEREYFSKLTEVQAYANCIYLEYKFYSDKPIEKLLKICNINQSSFTLRSMMETFDYDFSNEALCNVIKEVLRIDTKYNKVLT